MNDQCTTHKAAGLGNQSEQNRLTTPFRSVPQLDDETLVLDNMMQSLRGLKRCGRPRVSQIAREWERIINYRIQMTMRERKRRAKARVLRMQVRAALTASKPTSSPSGVRIRLNVSPSQD